MNPGLWIEQSSSGIVSNRNFIQIFFKSTESKNDKKWRFQLLINSTTQDKLHKFTRNFKKYYNEWSEKK